KGGKAARKGRRPQPPEQGAPAEAAPALLQPLPGAEEARAAAPAPLADPFSPAADGEGDLHEALASLGALPEPGPSPAPADADGDRPGKGAWFEPPEGGEAAPDGPATAAVPGAAADEGVEASAAGSWFEPP